MNLTLEAPDILDFPDKLLPLIEKFNDYKYFLIDGGRVSAKSQSVGRLILTVADQRKVRVCCGREIQANIEESVYTLLKDLILEKKLNWNVTAKSLEHPLRGSSVIFKGFREQGRVSIKGLEGVDILWIDESQAITKETLKVIIPTIRKTKAKVFFTMNRTNEDDAVYAEFANRPDCLHIHLNYNDNKHCPIESKIEAENMKTTDIDSYNHIWLGQPLLNGSNFIFPPSLITHCIHRYDMMQLSQVFNNTGVAVDPSGMGADDNVFLGGNDGLPFEIFTKTIMSPTEKALKAVEICKRINGWWIIIDCDGIGADTFLELQNLDDQFLCGIQLIKFYGSAPSMVSLTQSLKKNKPVYANMRAEAAFVSQKRAYAGLASIDPRDKHMIDELRADVSFVNRSGLLQLIEKKDIKEQLRRSPGRADAWKMFQYACSLDIKDQTFRQGRAQTLQTTADSNYNPIPGQEDVGQYQQTAD